MDKIRIKGGVPLHGKIRIGGAKNAALPLMAACLLTDQPLKLGNIPYLADITTMAKLLGQHGVRMAMQEPNGHGRDITLDASNITNLTAPYDIVRTMRASVLVLGPLLARFGEARVSLPGGCAIGTRPIDLHLQAFSDMGAEISLEAGYVQASAPKGLKGADIYFPLVSVGATENAMMAASLAHGTTTLHNAAREPEIGDLAQLLIKMGAKIEGIDTDTITIHGVASLHSAEHRVIADRIETGSYLVMAAATGGELELEDASISTSGALIDVLIRCGVGIEAKPGGIRVWREHDQLQALDITTAPYPAFPTDMQAQIMSLMALATGTSSITETIFENRYMHVPELVRMGADISVKDRTALITGPGTLLGAEVMATDLRASMSLIIAALAAEGETMIHRVYHLDRGYERLEDKLAKCGAQIERVK
jgi:UDP-N-acetylglucosamine 1-carboxyvinyltransferase